MSIKRFNARRDANEVLILHALAKCGVATIKCEDIDMLALNRGKVYMLEIKTAKGTLTKMQKYMIARGWPIHIVRTPEEALKAVGAIK